MRRRDFIKVIVGSASVWPVAALAQQAGIRRIGALMAGLAENDPVAPPRVRALLRGLQDLGWIEGRNLRIEYRWTTDLNRLPAEATEIVRSAPDVIFVPSNPGLAAVRNATNSIPVVFVSVADPVGSGFVNSLARPGSNITGFTNFEPSMGGKWLELLKDVAPGLTRVAIIHHPKTPANLAIVNSIAGAAPAFKMTLVTAGVNDAAEIERAIATFAAEPNGALVVVPHPVTLANRGLIIRDAARYRLPAVYPFRYFVAEGGLISYGIDQIDMYRRAAPYIDRILKGTKPSELPVQASDKFEMIINGKTAKALGLTVPPTLLARADEVIE